MIGDLDHYPHAFVIACIMDRQIKAEQAWRVPYEFSQRIGDFKFDTLKNLSLDQCIKHMSTPRPLHRYVNNMGRYMFLAIQRITRDYDGKAANIWSGNLSSAEVVYRFLQFDGIGPKIATMATNILARDFKISMSDYYSIDISPDVHVRRVFKRLGLISDNASIEEVIYKARALHPEYPGLMDEPAWQIGVNWCKPKNPKCGECYMKGVCPTAT